MKYSEVPNIKQEDVTRVSGKIKNYLTQLDFFLKLTDEQRDVLNKRITLFDLQGKLMPYADLADVELMLLTSGQRAQLSNALLQTSDFLGVLFNPQPFPLICAYSTRALVRTPYTENQRYAPLQGEPCLQVGEGGYFEVRLTGVRFNRFEFAVKCFFEQRELFKSDPRNFALLIKNSLIKDTQDMRFAQTVIPTKEPMFQVCDDTIHVTHRGNYVRQFPRTDEGIAQALSYFEDIKRNF